MWIGTLAVLAGKLGAVRKLAGSREEAGWQLAAKSGSWSKKWQLADAERTEHEELVVVHGDKLFNLAVDRTGVAHGLDHVAGAGLTLGPDHGRTLVDAAEGLAQVAAAADERNLQGMRQL